jgi:transposase
MRFVATKTPEQQSCLTLHRTRHLFIRQQTSVINAIRAHLAEFGIVAPVGRRGSNNCSGLLPLQMISGCPRLHASALLLSVPNCGC